MADVSLTFLHYRNSYHIVKVLYRTLWRATACTICSDRLPNESSLSMRWARVSLHKGKPRFALEDGIIVHRTLPVGTSFEGGA
jgi:hypothetical protein